MAGGEVLGGAMGNGAMGTARWRTAGVGARPDGRALTR